MLQPASLAHLDALTALENHCFETDRLSRRNFRHMLTKANAALLVDEQDGQLRGYVLVLFSRGTSMARLYSIAVDPAWRGQQISNALVDAAEQVTLEHDCVVLRLEIRRDNPASLALFQRKGYKPFKVVPDYYEDHMDALRFEKHLAPELSTALRKVPYYRQTLEFTCGPAVLIMAMRALSPKASPQQESDSKSNSKARSKSGQDLDRRLELQLWREATTIFMTSGHGGSSPYGLALAAYRRGFDVEIFVSERGVFLANSVRSTEKREVMRLVQEDWLNQLQSLPVPLQYDRLPVQAMQEKFDQGGIPLVLISSYRIYRERAPHWVIVTGFDDRFVYTHDPYVDEEEGETVTDSINMPIPRRDFERMAQYGRKALKAVVIVRQRRQTADG
ncbi:MAG: GNAT family N-acetyltransferase/peptidase C39 family protein [Gammaproteobacteria bacterium]